MRPLPNVRPRPDREVQENLVDGSVIYEISLTLVRVNESLTKEEDVEYRPLSLQRPSGKVN